MTERVGLSPRVARAVFLASFVIAAALGFIVTERAATAQVVAMSGPDFAHLMQFMVLIKGAMATAGAAAVVWRFGDRVGPTRLLAYCVAGALMAAGVGLIWDLVHVGAGAVLLHAGLIGTGVLLWRDPATARRLDAAVRARRRPR